MPAEKATALVLRTTDWSESSRIATLWTRQFGKVRVVAKGGRRLKSAFESALDLLTVCDIVLLRKSSGGLDLLTEAQVVRRFPLLAQNLAVLYAAYYVAEVLSDCTEDYDPHPILFDEALETLEALPETGRALGPRLARFELVLWRELGLKPRLENCAGCETPVDGERLMFSAAGGGVLCPNCWGSQRERQPLSAEGWRTLRAWSDRADAWDEPVAESVRAELRQLLNACVVHVLGRRPRLLPYLGS